MNSPKNLLNRYQSGLIAIGLVMLFWTLAPLVPFPYLSLLLNACAITIAIAVVVMYSPSAFRSLSSGYPDRVTQLCMGIALSFVVLVANRIGLMYEGYTKTLLFPFSAFLLMLAGVLHITPQNETNHRVSMWSWCVIGICIVCGWIATELIYADNGGVGLLTAAQNRFWH